jgi:RNA polymerase sigma factor (sigma-70 family)
LDRKEVNRLHRFALKFARRKLGKLPYIGVDERDLAQAAFEKFLRRWRQDICEPEAFLGMCVKHEIDAILRRQSTFRETYSYPENNVVPLHDPQLLQEQVIEDRQQQDELLKYIDQWNKDFRTYAELVFAYGEDITRRQAALLMNVDPTRIDTIKMRLRQILKKYLAEAENSDSPARRLMNKMQGGDDDDH